jgi:hypothetical protein
VESVLYQFVQAGNIIAYGVVGQVLPCASVVVGTFLGAAKTRAAVKSRNVIATRRKKHLGEPFLVFMAGSFGQDFPSALPSCLSLLQQGVINSRNDHC